MPLTNNTIIGLNEITMSVPDKNQLKPEDENLIKDIFRNIVESGERYDVYEIESWFALEGSWRHKSVVDRVVNIANYQQTKYEAKNKLRFVADDC